MRSVAVLLAGAVFTAMLLILVMRPQTGPTEEPQEIVGPFETATSTGDRYIAFSSKGVLYLRDIQIDGVEEISRTIPASSPAYPSVSADGRYVAFVAEVSPKSNGVRPDFDIFVYDRSLKTTELISVNTKGRGGNDYSDQSSISADGRYVVFMSYATDLVAGDTNKRSEVFIRDREKGITESIAVAGERGRTFDEFFLPKVSSEGRYVAFLSKAPDIVPEATNSSVNIFVHDRETDLTERLSTEPNWIQASESVVAKIEGDYALGRIVETERDALVQLVQALLDDLQ